MSYVRKPLLLLVCSLFLQSLPVGATVPSVETAPVPTPVEDLLAEGWAVYVEGDARSAKDVFAKAVSEAPRDARALEALYVASQGNSTSEEMIGLVARLLSAEEVHTAFIGAYLADMFPVLVDEPLRKAQRKIFERALAIGTLPPEQRNLIQRQYDIFLYVDNNPQAGIRSLGSQGSVLDWSFAGPFPNVHGSGFDAAYGPITEPQDDAVFYNQFNAPLGWRKMLNAMSGVTIAFGYYMDPKDAVAYAQTFVDVPTTDTYGLSFGLCGAAKVWIDDQLVFAQDEERCFEEGHLLLSQKLSAGTHRVLLQLGSAERSGLSYHLRIVDAERNPVPGLKASHSYRAYAKDKVESEVSYGRAFTAAQAASKAAPDDLTANLLLARQQVIFGRWLDAREVVNHMRDLYPKAPCFIELENELFKKEGSETGQAELMAYLRNNLPMYPLVIAERMQKAVEEEDYNLAENELEELEAINGSSSASEMLRVSLLLREENIPGAVKRLNGARKVTPSSQELMWLEYRIEAQVFNRPDNAREVVKTYLRDYNVDEVRAELAKVCSNQGDERLAIKHYRTILDELAYEVGHRRSIAQIHTSAQEYDAALEAYDEAIAQAPDVASFHRGRGEVLLKSKRKEEAVESYTRALQLNPNDFSLRTRLRELRDQPAVYAQLDSLDIMGVIEAQGNLFDETDYALAIIADDVRRIVYEDGVSEARYVAAYKVLNQKGIEQLSEYSLGGAGVDIFEAQVIKPSGQKIDGERGHGTVVFPKLAVGDYVYVSYRVREYYEGKMFGKVWADYQMSGTYPSNESRYQVLFPKDYPLKYELINSDAEPALEELGEFDKLTFSIERPKLIEYEDYMPATTDVAEVLHLSSVPDWDYVASWYDELSAKRTESDYTVRAAVKSVFPQGSEGLSEEEKSRRIYEYIVKEVSYSSLPFRQNGYVPQRAGKTLRTKLGDCKDVSSLFVAMGREVGVGAQLVLVDTRDNGERDLVMPNTEFNHCIVQLDATDEYVELTDQYLPYAAVGPRLRGSIALPVARDGAARDLCQVTASKKRNGIDAYTELAFEGDDLRLSRRSQWYGQLASMQRYDYHDVSRKDQGAELHREIGTRLDKSFSLEEFRFEHLGDLSDTVVVDYAITIDGAVSKMQSMRFFQLPWLHRNTSLDFLNDKERTNPIELWLFTSSDRKFEEIAVELPADAALVETPSDVELEIDGMTYSLRFTLEDNQFKAARTWTRTRDSYAAAEFGDVRKFLRAMDEADQQLIGIK